MSDLAVEEVVEVLRGEPAALGLLGIVHEIEADGVTVRFGDDVLHFPASFLRPRPDADPIEVEASYL